MALDLHAAANENEASRTACLASISEASHRELFHLRLLRNDECRLLSRMKNYRADAVYSGVELERLAAETDDLAKRVNPNLAGVLQRVGDAARKAFAERLNLYAFCD